MAAITTRISVPDVADSPRKMRSPSRTAGPAILEASDGRSAGGRPPSICSV